MFWRSNRQTKPETTDLQPLWNAIGELKSQISSLKPQLDALEDQILSLRNKINKVGPKEDLEPPKNLNTGFNINPFK